MVAGSIRLTDVEPRRKANYAIGATRAPMSASASLTDRNGANLMTAVGTQPPFSQTGNYPPRCASCYHPPSFDPYTPCGRADVSSVGRRKRVSMIKGADMSTSMQTTVVVRRQWNAWKKGKVAIDRMWGFHWRSTSGGVGARSPRPMLYAKISCDSLLDGEIDHSGIHGPCPHEILVCIVKKDNPKIFDALASRATNAFGPECLY